MIFQDRCERIAEQINLAAEEKINAILETKQNLLKEATDLQKSGDMTALALKSSLEEAIAVATKAMADKTSNNDKDQVSMKIQLWRKFKCKPSQNNTYLELY